VLKHVADLEATEYDDEKAYCCGGSLGNIKIGRPERQKIAVDAASKLTLSNPDYLITSCPLCKKTFSGATGTKVADIAEIVAEAMVLPVHPRKSARRVRPAKEPVHNHANIL